MLRNIQIPRPLSIPTNQNTLSIKAAGENASRTHHLPNSCNWCWYRLMPLPIWMPRPISRHRHSTQPKFLCMHTFFEKNACLGLVVFSRNSCACMHFLKKSISRSSCLFSIYFAPSVRTYWIDSFLIELERYRNTCVYTAYQLSCSNSWEINIDLHHHFQGHHFAYLDRDVRPSDLNSSKSMNLIF